MKIIYHPHARQRMKERGANQKEVEAAFRTGEKFKAKFGRLGFRRNFSHTKGKYTTKQVEVYGVMEIKQDTFVVITVICKYF